MKVKSALAMLVALLFFSLPSSAYVQVIDNFESGNIGSHWTVAGDTADVGLYNLIEVKQWGVWTFYMPLLKVYGWWF